MRIYTRLLVSALALSGVAVGAADPSDPGSWGRRQSHIDKAARVTTELGSGHQLSLVRYDEDELGMSHAYFVQYYKGLSVFGGAIITHMDRVGNSHPSTDSLFRDIT